MRSWSQCWRGLAASFAPKSGQLSVGAAVHSCNTMHILLLKALETHACCATDQLPCHIEEISNPASFSCSQRLAPRHWLPSSPGSWGRTQTLTPQAAKQQRRRLLVRRR